MTVQCKQCGRELAGQGAKSSVASISGSIVGDEDIESYFFCQACGVYTVEVYHDRFLGEDEISLRGPIPKAAGDSQVELIRQCSEPWNKKCRCQAHKSYFGEWLD